jgi:1-acyl-sn-glycerol-3-phosphate acyltransferase
LIAHAHQGRTLVFFPEGTFTRRAGLSGFYLGAFKVAAEANLPVLPGIIRGTRSMLRSDQWFPRRAAISVEIGEPVMPSGADFTYIDSYQSTEIETGASLVTRHKEMVHAAELSCLCRRVSDPKSLHLRWRRRVPSPKLEQRTSTNSKLCRPLR